MSIPPGASRNLKALLSGMIIQNPNGTLTLDLTGAGGGTRLASGGFKDYKTLFRALMSVDSGSDASFKLGLRVGADQVFTSSGSTVETELTSVGGAIYDAVVDAAGGADYTTLRDAVTAGSTSIFLRDGTYTESAGDVTLLTNTTIVGESRDGVIINMDTNQLITATGVSLENVTVQFQGDGIVCIPINGDDIRFENCRFSFTNGSNPGGTTTFISDQTVARKRTVIKNCIADMGGSPALSNLRFLSMQSSGSVGTSVDGLLIINNLGGGQNLMRLDANNSLYFNVSAPVASLDANSITIASSDSIYANFQNLSFSHNGLRNRFSNCLIVGASTFSGSRSTFSNCIATTIGTTITVSGTKLYFDNCHWVNPASISFGASASKCTFANCLIRVIVDDAGISGQKFDTCDFEVALSILSDGNQYDSCSFEGVVTGEVGAVLNQMDNCIFEAGVIVNDDGWSFTGCRAGSVTGGGSETITLTSGVDNALIHGCRTDAPIVNSGTGTVLDNNFEF